MMVGFRMSVEKKCDLRSGRTEYLSTTYDEIVTMLSSGVITFYSEVRSGEGASWVSLLSFQDFPKYIGHKLRIATAKRTHDSLFTHWYLKDGERRFGPFSVLQILEFFCQSRIDLDQLVRHPSFSHWEALGTSSLFEVRSLGELLACETIRSLVSRRKQPRIEYDNEVFVSVRAELLQGVCYSLSSGGLGVLISDEALIKMGDLVNVIINANSDHGAVQVKGRVVSLRKEMNKVRLALEFENENQFLNLYISQRIPS